MLATDIEYLRKCKIQIEEMQSKIQGFLEDEQQRETDASILNNDEIAENHGENVEKLLIIVEALEETWNQITDLT